jgi:hypothetical protein
MNGRFMWYKKRVELSKGDYNYVWRRRAFKQQKVAIVSAVTCHSIHTAFREGILKTRCYCGNLSTPMLMSHIVSLYFQSLHPNNFQISVFKNYFIRCIIDTNGRIMQYFCSEELQREFHVYVKAFAAFLSNCKIAELLLRMLHVTLYSCIYIYIYICRLQMETSAGLLVSIQPSYLKFIKSLSVFYRGRFI